MNTIQNWLFRYHGRSLDFSKEFGGGITLHHTQGTYQIGMSTSRRFFTKSDFFWMSIERKGEGQAYKIAAWIN